MVLFWETDEESGSKDLLQHLKNNKDLVGDTHTLICLDSGTYNYNFFCLTTALRGVVNYDLRVDYLESSQSSSMFSNVY